MELSVNERQKPIILKLLLKKITVENENATDGFLKTACAVNLIYFYGNFGVMQTVDAVNTINNR